MAVLPDNDRQRVATGLARYWSLFRTSVPVLASDVRDAVNATDSWIDSNQASYNSALPVAFESGASTAQKTLLFCAVALARVSIQILRVVFGEVD